MVRTLALLWFLLASSPPVAQSLTQKDTLILAALGDPYYPLAEEMARRETLAIKDTLDEALAQDPGFILWVVSPSFLSEQVMVDAGLALRDWPSSVSVGIISGKTLEDAEALWLRASDVGGQRIFAANTLNPAGNIEAELIEFGEDTVVQPLSLENLMQSLQVADYLTFSGHGGSS